MFSLWKAWVQRHGLSSYNPGCFCTVSPGFGMQQSKNRLLYQVNALSIHQVIHTFFLDLTGVFNGLYPRSTEPITTTTLYKGGRI